jgi:hypothetical protein
MKSGSGDQGRTAVVGFVKGPSPERAATDEMRRFRTFPYSPRNGKVRPKTVIHAAVGSALARRRYGWRGSRRDGGWRSRRLTGRQVQARQEQLAVRGVSKAAGVRYHERGNSP